MTIILDISIVRDVRAYTELVLYTIMLIIVLITYFKVRKLQSVRFLKSLLMILLALSLTEIYAGIYWSSYFPGPYTADNPRQMDLWLGLATVSEMVFEVCSHLTIWLICFKFYDSASQLNLIETHLQQAETRKKSR